MDVIFELLDPRRYGVEARRPGAPTMRMAPAPGFDRWMPHDLQHFLVEEQLGITDAIFGRLAAGGTAGTFTPVLPGQSGRARLEREPGDHRAAGRQRRRLARRNESLRADTGGEGVARSERATIVATQAWLASCPEPVLQARARELAPTAAAVRARMAPAEGAALDAALPRLVPRFDEVARAFAALEIGGHLTIPWAPIAPGAGLASRHGGRANLRRAGQPPGLGPPGPGAGAVNTSPGAGVATHGGPSVPAASQPSTRAT